MATDLTFEINGQPLGLPEEYKSIEVDANFVDRQEGSASITTSNLTFTGEDSVPIRGYFDQGTGSGLGVLESPELVIRHFCKGGNIEIFRGGYDISDTSAVFECDRVSAPIIENDTIDFLRDLAPSISFAYLFDQGTIKQSDFVEVFYSKEDTPDFLQLALLGFASYSVVKELALAIKFASDAIADALSGITGGLVAAARIIVAAIYVITVLIALVALFKTILDNLINIPRKHLGMKIKTLFERGAQQLGFTPKSTIFNDDSVKNWVLVPPKREQGAFVLSSPKGVGYPEQNYAQFLETWAQVFDAEVKVRNGNELHFERVDSTKEVSSYQIPDNIEIDAFGTNAAEVRANTFVEFAVDATDNITLENLEGFSYQVTEEPKKIGNQKNVRVKNLQQVTIPYSLGTRKNDKNQVEVALETSILFLVNLVKKTKSLFRKGASTSDLKIDGRLGFLRVQKDTFSTGKLLYIQNNKIPSNHKEVLSAKYIYENFQKRGSFIPSSEYPNANQWLIYRNIDVPFCCEDFLKIKNNNIITDNKGRKVRIDALRWNIFEERASIDFRINELYTRNLKQTVIEDGEP